MEEGAAVALSDWDPVMVTLYLAELYAEIPKRTPVSEARRRFVVDTIVVDLRHRADEQDRSRDAGHGEHRHPQPVDIYAVND